MSCPILIDYGCHSFTYRLAKRLRKEGLGLRYFVNGSLESPNLSSVATWAGDQPELVRNITCESAYGKLSLKRRLLGELEWAGRCVAALAEEQPSVVIACCIPIAAVTRIQSWCRRENVPFVYWLQDLQGRATANLLARNLGSVGNLLGALVSWWEQRLLANSDLVVTIAPGHEDNLPKTVRGQRRYALLENWANIEEIPLHHQRSLWSVRHGLQHTRNLLYAGTLGLKHDLNMLTKLAESMRSEEDVRVVIVSSGQGAEHLKTVAAKHRLSNLTVLPFQPCDDVPAMLGSAAIFIAPLDPSAGSFCVPSKVLSYLCAGRPTVIAIDEDNAAAKMIRGAGAGSVVPPGDSGQFVGAVRELLNDEPRRLREGAAARTFALNTFSLDRIVPRFLAILSRVSIEAAQPASPETEPLLAGSASARD